MYATDKALYKAKERGRACYVFGEAESKEQCKKAVRAKALAALVHCVLSQE